MAWPIHTGALSGDHVAKKIVEQIPQKPFRPVIAAFLGAITIKFPLFPSRDVVRRRLHK